MRCGHHIGAAAPIGQGRKLLNRSASDAAWVISEAVSRIGQTLSWWWGSGSNGTESSIQIAWLLTRLLGLRQPGGSLRKDQSAARHSKVSSRRANRKWRRPVPSIETVRQSSGCSTKTSGPTISRNSPHAGAMALYRHWPEYQPSSLVAPSRQDRQSPNDSTPTSSSSAL